MYGCVCECTHKMYVLFENFVARFFTVFYFASDGGRITDEQGYFCLV